MKTAQILISDTHFGAKNNSLVWLESQVLFFEKQIFPTISKLKSEYDEITLVHCGDLFDSKSSINLFVWKAVKTLLERLCDRCDHVVIIGGNHDYYSNTRQDYNINSIESFKGLKDNLHIVENEGLAWNFNENARILFSPWFEFNNQESLKNSIDRNKPSVIFTHTDLEHMDLETKALTKKIPVVSGHVHYPFDKDGNICLGSCYGLTFNDCNQPRYCWIMQDWDLKTLVKMPNVNSIRFWRLKNGEPVPRDAKKWDKIEMYLGKEEYKEGKFDEYIKETNEKFSDCKCVLIENSKEILENTDFDCGSFDIKRMISDSIPENLKEKFKIVEENYNKSVL